MHSLTLINNCYLNDVRERYCTYFNCTVFVTKNQERILWKQYFTEYCILLLIQLFKLCIAVNKIHLKIKINREILPRIYFSSYLTVLHLNELIEETYEGFLMCLLFYGLSFPTLFYYDCLTFLFYWKFKWLNLIF